ncbi:MAG: hypothetical protein IJN28_05145 [Selenomonadales bacterium]|nr:hypothetical protein [Selenomonadales bacterium]
MYVAKKDDGKTYVYIRNGKTYVSTLSLQATSVLTIYMPDGTLLTNASVVINGETLITDSLGKIYVEGEKNTNASFDIVYNEMYMATVEVSYGEDASVHLVQMHLLTVTATDFTYSEKFTITTNINGVSYIGSLSVYLAPDTSVTVTAQDTSSDADWIYMTYVKLDGTNTKKGRYTFTMDTSHDITFTNGSSSYVGSGT